VIGGARKRGKGARGIALKGEERRDSRAENEAFSLGRVQDEKRDWGKQ